MSPTINGTLKVVSPNYFSCTLGEASKLKETNPTSFRTVSNLLESQALNRPNEFAFGFPDPNTENGKWGSRLYTFEDLERGSRMDKNDIQQLKDSNGKSKTIALLCPSSIQFLFTWLRLVRVGYSVLIIAPQCQPEAILHLCKSCAAPVLMYERSLAEKALATCRLDPASITALEVAWEIDLLSTNINGSEEILTHRSLEDDIAYIFHTSGTSSGLPKPVPQSHHAAVGVLPSLSSDVATFTTTPLYHGGIADCFRAWSSGAMIWLFPEMNKPITTQNILRSLSSATSSEQSRGTPRVGYFASVPYILEMLSEEFDGREMLKRMDMVGVGGGALSSKCGNHLVEEGVKLISRMGSAECGFLLSSDRDFKTDRDWQFLRVPPGSQHLHFEEQADASDLSELVVLEGWPHVSKINREDGSFATSDLFEPHPETRNAWRYHSRSDSQIILKTGKKFDPAPLEDEIRCAIPEIGDAYIFGNGKQTPGLLIFPSISEVDANILDVVWEIVREINDHGQDHTRISRSMIGVIPHGSKSLDKSNKGTILRRQAEMVFADEISALYQQGGESNGSWKTAEIFSEHEIRRIVEYAIAKKVGRERKIQHTEDFYRHGINSTQCTQIRDELERNLHLRPGTLPWNVVYDCGNIEGLSSFLLGKSYDSGGLKDNDAEMEAMLEMVKRFSVFEPPTQPHMTQENDNQSTAAVVVLTGTTGLLGVHVLELLRRSDKVHQIICLVRASSHKDARLRVSKSLVKRNKSALKSSKGRIICVPSDFTASDLGVTPELRQYIQEKATHIIHAAWAVNFSISLASFEDQLSGLQNLLKLGMCCSNQTQFLFCSSTASVLGQQNPTKIEESVSTNPSDSDTLGYSRSKWVAEAICDSASRVPHMNQRIKILRIGQLTGDTENGIWNMSEAWPLMLSTVHTLGCLPRLDEKLTWLPVDIAAQTVLDIAFGSTKVDDDMTCLVYHIINNRQEVSWMDLLGWIENSGQHFKVLDMNAWLTKLEKLNDHPAKSLSGLWKAGKESRKKNAKSVILDCKRSAASSDCLRNFGGVDETLIRKIWCWLKSEIALQRET